jgi:hypothetical protein
MNDKLNIWGGLEVWIQKDDSSYKLFKTYNI